MKYRFTNFNIFS